MRLLVVSPYYPHHLCRRLDSPAHQTWSQRGGLVWTGPASGISRGVLPGPSGSWPSPPIDQLPRPPSLSSVLAIWSGGECQFASSKGQVRTQDLRRQWLSPREKDNWCHLKGTLHEGVSCGTLEEDPPVARAARSRASATWTVKTATVQYTAAPEADSKREFEYRKQIDTTGDSPGEIASELSRR